jgi:hypothetical protein
LRNAREASDANASSSSTSKSENVRPPSRMPMPSTPRVSPAHTIGATSARENLRYASCGTGAVTASLSGVNSNPTRPGSNPYTAAHRNTCRSLSSR